MHERQNWGVLKCLNYVVLHLCASRYIVHAQERVYPTVSFFFVLAHQGEMFAVMTCSLGPDLHPRISVLVTW